MIHAVTVEIGGIRLGVDVQDVQEVWRAPEVLAVPRSSPAIAGLINRRGSVMTLVRGHRALGIEGVDDAPEADEHQVIILEHGGEKLAIAVSRLVDTIEVHPDRLTPVPPKLPEGVQRVAEGLHPDDEGFTIMVSASKIFDSVRASGAESSTEQE